MSSKRSRIVRSSSQGEVGLLNQMRPLLDSPIPILAPPARQQVDSKPSPPPLRAQREKPRDGILTLYSPERETSTNVEPKKEKGELGFGEFLDACSLCKKKFKQDMDIFMYGYLKAFCSPDCRDDQIALDGFDEKTSLESTKMKMPRNAKPMSKRGLGN
ncbi:DUF581 domain-containing protein [Cephalotus follicularis]|uniref:DUF581 domain-containing protein n=1 Tax=Cephalotus follicularis TaxID=3775 RepID=A0A1Q3CKK1_CEPFO|nr:DUF581 domain-containing protein [Cephalotus follicularis]